MNVGQVVRIKNYEDTHYGKTATIMTIVRMSHIDLYKRRYYKEYIVQFDKPAEWSFYNRHEIELAFTINKGGSNCL